MSQDAVKQRPWGCEWLWALCKIETALCMGRVERWLGDAYVNVGSVLLHTVYFMMRSVLLTGCGAMMSRCACDGTFVILVVVNIHLHAAAD